MVVLGGIGHTVMERRMLNGIKRRAEGTVPLDSRASFSRAGYPLLTIGRIPTAMRNRGALA